MAAMTTNTYIRSLKENCYKDLGSLVSCISFENTKTIRFLCIYANQGKKCVALYCGLVCLQFGVVLRLVVTGCHSLGEKLPVDIAIAELTIVKRLIIWSFVPTVVGTIHRMSLWPQKQLNHQLRPQGTIAETTEVRMPLVHQKELSDGTSYGNTFLIFAQVQYFMNPQPDPVVCTALKT
ncbi:hypothetical protein FF38_06776 [Lucilia cuprina]|uniref:Uncharacterized protein n=1 Tax=Lucilia cuprina TaxID=7375 RepID=A0A0L0CR41_LUCCU|nr:hypothetical protein FF38_06776 [Lucilia cuprina]